MTTNTSPRELEFHYQDLQKDMDKRNLAKFYTNLEAFAIIQFAE